MNVLKIVIVSLFFVRLFAVNLYVPKDFANINIKDINIKTYKSKKEINFSNSLVMLSYNDLPYIFEKNLEIITPIGEVKEYILTHNKPLCKVRKVINLDFASKILLDKCDRNYTAIRGDFKDFLAHKADAVIYPEGLERADIFDFPLKLYGIDFNRYFIVGSKNFIKKNYKKIEKLNYKFENSFDFRKDLIYKTLFISSLYLNKHINFNKILFENYKLVKEKNKKTIIVNITNWPPFTMYSNGKIYGIGVDFWKLIAKKAHIKYDFKIIKSWNKVLNDIKTKKTDIYVATSATPDRKKYALFSKPYASFPLGIICRNDENFNSINDIKSIAVGKNFTAEKLMKKYYPNLNYIETKHTFQALTLVKNKKAQCAVDILPVMLWTISKNHLMNLQLAFKTPFKFNVQMMVRNDYPELIAKINKVIDEITPQQKERVINTYLKSIVIEQKHNINKYLLLIIIVVVFIVLILFYINRQKFKKVKKEAMYDELTGILNRRGIDVKVKDMEDKGSILFFDIDHFKQVNDTYGHEFGDYVLKELGKILKQYFRKSDIVGRWGGEEFIAILPNTEYKDALIVAEKLRQIIEKYNFKGKNITVSIGISEYKGNLEENLKKADEALYEAKNNGRNQIKGKQ